MKLFELGNRRPTEAGLAVLKYSKEEKLVAPRREANTIILPDEPNSDLFLLKNGDQFIFRKEPKYNEWEELWFGGTDENPFLVHLDPAPYKEYISKGENAFFLSIAPPEAIEMAKKFKTRVIRQGDIFCIPTGLDSKELEQVLCTAKKIFTQHLLYDKGCIPFEVLSGTWSVFGTRHSLTGKIICYCKWEYGKASFFGIEKREERNILARSNMVFGLGKLEAPDHAVLDIESPSLFYQTRFLSDPQKAD